MYDAKTFCRMAGIEPAVLEAWVDAGWLSPQQGRQGWRFSTIDLMRVQLIFDLAGPMGINDEGIAVILHLVDQIHGLRRALRGATSPPSPAVRLVVPDRPSRAARTLLPARMKPGH
jgi:chaperone modulatory protein CbpM